MVLLLAVAAGLTAGLLRSWVSKQPYRAPDLNLVWLVTAAVLPQIAAFHYHPTARLLPDQVASWLLILSQLVLLIFAGANIHQPGFWLLTAGLILNLLVILINGGWMPISTNTILTLHPEVPLSAWPPGHRPGFSKNILLFPDQIRLSLLADRFMLPTRFPWPRAYSLGDILIASGTLILLWKPDGVSLLSVLFPPEPETVRPNSIEEVHHEP
jgi:hypothetical protein